MLRERLSLTIIPPVGLCYHPTVATGDGRHWSGRKTEPGDVNIKQQPTVEFNIPSFPE